MPRVVRRLLRAPTDDTPGADPPRELRRYWTWARQTPPLLAELDGDEDRRQRVLGGLERRCDVGVASWLCLARRDYARSEGQRLALPSV